MRSTRRRAAKNVLFKAGVLFYASSTVTNTAAQSQDNCVSFSSDSTAGNPEDALIADPTFFSCADGSFLTGVEASYLRYIFSLSWTCSDREEIGSFSSDTVGERAVSFVVGITGVQTGVTVASPGFLADMYFGGYDVDEDNADGMTFSWKGPLGEFYDDDTLLPGTSASYCGSGDFATGVTVWASTRFVYGVTLECATVTDTCAPPNYPDSLQDGSDSGSSNLDFIIGASAGGGLLLIAIAVGVTCCICRRRPSKKAPHNETTGQSTAAVVTAAPREQGHTVYKENIGAVSHASAGVPPAPSCPPPVYHEPPTYHEPPPPPAYY